MDTVIKSRFIEYNDDELSEKEVIQIKDKLEKNFKNTNYCYLLLDLSLRDINYLALDNEFYEYIKVNYSKLEFLKFGHDIFNYKNVPSLFSLNLKDRYQSKILEQSILLSYQELKPEHLLAGYGRAICGWLFSNENIENIGNYLANLCIQRNKMTNNYYLLRLYDPAVLSSLLSLILPEIRDKILAATTCWSILNGDGILKSYYAKNTRWQIVPHQLGLIEREIKCIANIGIENQTLVKYRDIYKNQPRYCEERARQIIRHALVIADQYDLNDEQDKVLFALHSLTIGSEFYRTPKIAELLKVKDVYYQKRVASITFEQWQEIKQQCNQLILGENYAV